MNSCLFEFYSLECAIFQTQLSHNDTQTTVTVYTCYMPESIESSKLVNHPQIVWTMTIQIVIDHFYDCQMYTFVHFCVSYLFDVQRVFSRSISMLHIIFIYTHTHRTTRESMILNVVYLPYLYTLFFSVNFKIPIIIIYSLWK